MKKNNKGFTLVELMAVVIILIIVIFIAITRVNESSRRARNEAVRANAATYIKAVNNFVAVESVDNDKYENTSLTLPMIKESVKVSGTIPDSANFTITDSEISYACLEYNGFKITYNNGKLSDVSSGTCDNGSLIAYSGSETVYTVPTSGVYRLEAWGAQGGSYNDTYYGGYGGYSVGDIYLNSGDILYINIGGQGSKPTADGYLSGGYNGGGDSYTIISSCSNSCSSGGGATSIAKASGVIKNVSPSNLILVAGGGSGAAYRNCSGSDYQYSSGAAGGGYIGSSETYFVSYYSKIYASGGTQSAGGAGSVSGESGSEPGSYGVGGKTSRTGGYTCGTGGGGGYYGGGNGMFVGGGGGSGYIGYSGLFNKHMTCYECEETDDVNTFTYSNEDVSSTPVADKSKKGNGAVKITYVRSTIEDTTPTNTYVFSYSGHEEVFTAPKDGKYKLEVWGAQGGSSKSLVAAYGGYGGYSVGDVTLSTGDKLYINVGGKGTDGDNSAITKNGGYNGGGDKITPDYAYYSAAGGGATHIALSTGLLTTFDSNRGDLLIVAGGGGGAAGVTDNYGYGGSGGGFQGSRGSNYLNNIGWGAGGTQTVAGCKNTSSEYCASFGAGNNTSSAHGGAGGGGFYGGGSTAYDNIGGGGGGSGYIGNSSLSNKEMYCYNCTESSDASTKTISTTCKNIAAKSKCAKKGNGYVKITFIQ